MQRKIGPRAVCGQTHVPWSGVAASAAEAAVSAADSREGSEMEEEKTLVAEGLLPSCQVHQSG